MYQFSIYFHSIYQFSIYFCPIYFRSIYFCSIYHQDTISAPLAHLINGEYFGNKEARPQSHLKTGHVALYTWVIAEKPLDALDCLLTCRLRQDPVGHLQPVWPERFGKSDQKCPNAGLPDFFDHKLCQNGKKYTKWP
jgi:hypothetical protein